ncbi:MAG: T9SS type A sorting domain-containing protein, partial [Chitinophagales bacterium]
SNTQRDTVAVNPTPLLSSATTGSVCSGAPFSYTPGSFTPGAAFAWQRNLVPNITPATASGNGAIHDTMVNSTLLPINVVYLYRLGINGCTNNHTDKVTVTVKAKPPVPSIVIGPGHNLCSNTLYQNFGASDSATVNYSWSAENATLWATGNTGQYAIVSFNNPGTAVITLNSNLPAVSCITANTYAVTVSSAVSDNPQVIYYDGQFICLQTNEESYQWGYDNASTLDSTLLSGETYQNYSNTNPDFAHKYYWVMTKLNGCMQKTYYNAPNGVTDINADVAGIKVYPNPANDNINVDINTKIAGDIQVEVINMLGQKVSTVTAVNHKARINIASLPAGCYLVDCSRDGVKIATAKFIKN